MKYLKSFWIFTLVMLWGGVALLTSPCLATEPELIPREVLFGNPVKAAPTISPDGKLLAYLAPLDNVLNICICSSPMRVTDLPNQKTASSSMQPQRSSWQSI